ncbi:MAG: ATP-dependent Clp protease proteolytic subunit [Nitrospirae bacterium]|nr:ATP-dependent Clp protease proteolytic subunit [Nitrospirota bacterium]MBF0535624.1 ATP-dependent Clp protease proteolytic subunit [Nitrospirota bacterium]MBF0616930.1 ATP-dependent Clp protease proteolytic subunit [Nitrospirota bacterium]
MKNFDHTIKTVLDERLEKLSEHFGSDAVFYYGDINPGYLKAFRDFIEQLKSDNNSKNRLTIMLNTNGGSVETVEKMVEIIRHHYQEIFFIIPDHALSAGTIFCMSGDKIYMDYSSSLGPIDPQVYINNTFVPALGYLDKANELVEKSKQNTLTSAEFVILQNMDLALLRKYEQARDLTVTLLKEWLVKYKFSDWKIHKTTQSKKGKEVTKKEKQERAEEIAKLLGDNKLWHSHGRFIGIKTLRDVLKLEIEDYSNKIELKTLIRDYNDFICEYIIRAKVPLFMHSKYFF